nr:hypothetical protein [Tanacetum cinerariifolium]
MAELILREYEEETQAKSNISIINNNMNIKLDKEFSTKLQVNAYHGMLNEDIVDHIAKVLKMLDLINIPELILREYEEETQAKSNLSIINNNMNIKLDKEFSTKLQVNAYHGMLNEDIVDHIAKVLKMLDLINIPGMDSDQLILSSNDTVTDSFFNPYLHIQEKNNIGDEQGQTKHQCSNTSNSNDEQPNKRVCKAEKFEAIKYSLGPNEECIAIRRYEYDAWERNEESAS